MQSDADLLKTRFTNLSAKIGVIGLGYVGLPLLLAFHSRGFCTYGFDIDENKISRLNNGESYIKHIQNHNLKPGISDGTIIPTTDFSKIRDVDALMICVPTPLDVEKNPDLSYVISTANEIKNHLRSNQLIILESTTYPGTTREILKPILEESGLKSGIDIYIAFSPEREDPGNTEFTTKNIPKVVGGDGIVARDLTCILYNKICAKTVPVSSLEVAEGVKLTENIFRSVNIAMINELKIIYDKMGIDVWEVIEAAKSKPFGYMPFYPGPGLGGHCIPIDPFYLSFRAQQYGQDTKFIKLAGELNTHMPHYVVDILKKAMNEKLSLVLTNSKVLLVGVAYKKNIDDTRESPGFVIMDLLESLGVRVDYYDPLIPEIPITRGHPALVGRKSIKWSKKNISQYDAALICTDHDIIDYEKLVNYSKLIVDTRNATASFKDRQFKIVKA